VVGLNQQEHVFTPSLVRSCDAWLSALSNFGSTSNEMSQNDRSSNALSSHLKVSSS
jgi:hypothetical protein